MGIVNASPDSFSDAGELPDTRRADRPRARARRRRGADRRRRRRDRARRARTRRDRGGDRARRAGRRGGRRRARRARLRRHLQAGRWPRPRSRRARRSSTTSPACATRGWRRSARGRAPRSSSCTRASRPRGRCSIPPTTTTSWPTSAPGSPTRSRARRRPASTRSSCCSTPGPDFAKTPAQTVAVLRRLDVLHDLGRPLLLALSRKDFLGAITGRGPRERGPATLAAVGWAAGAGAHVLRLHDVAAAADFLAVRAVLGGDARARAGRRAHAGALPRRGAAAFRAARRLPWMTLPAAAHNAAGLPSDRPKESRMTSVLDRDALEQSPLADLHLIANELGVDGFRRLRKAELIDAIIASQSDGDEPPARGRRRARRGGGAAARPRRAAAAPSPTPRSRPRTRPRRARPTRTRPRGRDRRGRAAARAAAAAGAAGAAAATRTREEPRAAEPEDRVAEGVVELLGNGSAFIRLNPPETTDDDVYVSAAQVKRCELVSGDRIAGPVRAPRRSERFPSLVRVDTINGKPADEVAEGTKFEDLPGRLAGRAARARLRGRDAQGRRVADAVRQGLARRDRRRARAPASRELARGIAGGARRPRGPRGARRARGRPPGGDRRLERRRRRPRALTFAASPDAQAQAVEQAVEQGRRVAARGGDAVVVDRHARVRPAARRPQGARRGAQHRRRRLADRDRDRAGAVRRRVDGRRARRRS